MHDFSGASPLATVTVLKALECVLAKGDLA